MSERLTVGQKLWKVPNDPRRRKYADWVEVSKVGRVWAETKQRDRIRIETLRSESPYGNGDGFYRTREEYDEACRLSLAWDHLEKNLRGYGRRPISTVEKIEQALGLLGYDVAEFRAALSREEGR